VSSESHTLSNGLYIEADLTVGLAASTLRVHSVDGVLYIDARSFEALQELRAAADSDGLCLLTTLGTESPFTVETPVVVRVRGVSVGYYRPDKRAGRLAESLGIAPFKPSLRGVLRAVVRRVRPPR